MVERMTLWRLCELPVITTRLSILVKLKRWLCKSSRPPGQLLPPYRMFGCQFQIFSIPFSQTCLRSPGCVTRLSRFGISCCEGASPQDEYLLAYLILISQGNLCFY